jgi:hypothetical protein
MEVMMTQNPKATEKTVVITLRFDTDSMTELYGRLAEVVKSVENSADIISVNVIEDKKIGVGIR